MQELFKALEVYIDERILVRTNDLEGLQIRDANRIADLERRLFGAVDMIEMQRGWIKELNDAKGVVTDDDDTDQKLEDFEYRISELECTIEDKVSEDYVDHLVEDVKNTYDLDAAAHDAVVTILTRETFKLVRGD
tara:strand:+ start:3194 stop:3598 length:405 start_codon:yes stop_codon:yes gene_type:complete